MDLMHDRLHRFMHERGITNPEHVIHKEHKDAWGEIKRGWEYSLNMKQNTLGAMFQLCKLEPPIYQMLRKVMRGEIVQSKSSLDTDSARKIKRRNEPGGPVGYHHFNYIAHVPDDKLERLFECILSGSLPVTRVQTVCLNYRALHMTREKIIQGIQNFLVQSGKQSEVDANSKWDNCAKNFPSVTDDTFVRKWCNTAAAQGANKKAAEEQLQFLPPTVVKMLVEMVEMQKKKITKTTKPVRSFSCTATCIV